MKIGHLIFPILFFLVLITGAYFIMRTVDDISYTGPNQPVYLEASDRKIEILPEKVGAARENAHQAFIRFADDLVEQEMLSAEEKETLNQILQLGEGHWEHENWAPSFYAFERVINDITPLIQDGLGLEKAKELERQYTELSESITTEIVLVESLYLEAFGTANLGYNAMEAKDWVGAIQAFAKALDTLHLVKAQAAEIVDKMLQEGYKSFNEGDMTTATDLFNVVLAAYPESEEALRGMELIQSELSKTELLEPLEDEIVIVTSEDFVQSEPSLPAPEDFEAELGESTDPMVAKGDWHYAKRELKDSLSLYIEAYSKNPDINGLSERISRTRNELRREETIRLMDKAKILADLDQWEGVIKAYRQILNVDPVHKEARQGWEEALVSFVNHQELVQYKELLRHHLNARQFSLAKEVFLEAKDVLSEREDFEEAFFILQRNLEFQQVPVKIVLKSDGETWVSIVGKLPPEQFTEKEITVFPGELKIYGWKKGFKHTEHASAFDVSTAPDVITIACEVVNDTVSKYTSLKGEERVIAAMNTYDLSSFLKDEKAFVSSVSRSAKLVGSTGGLSQANEWDRSLFFLVYSELVTQSEREYENARFDARAHFIEVPRNLSRKEAIELGQYLIEKVE